MWGCVKLAVFAKPLNKSADKITASFLSVVLTLEKRENIAAALMSFINKILLYPCISDTLNCCSEISSIHCQLIVLHYGGKEAKANFI